MEVIECNIQETCNLIVDLTQNYLDPTSIFQVEVEEALDKLKVSLRTLKDFKVAFQKYKGLLPSYFKDKETKKSWDFQVRFHVNL